MTSETEQNAWLEACSIDELKIKVRDVTRERDWLRDCLSRVRSAVSAHDEFEHVKTDAWRGMLERRLDKGRKYTLRIILTECMGLRWEQHSRSKLARLSNLMRHLGWKQLYVHGITRQYRVWRYAGTMGENIDPNEPEDVETMVGPLGPGAYKQLKAFLDESMCYTSKELLIDALGIPESWNRHTREKQIDLCRIMRALGWQNKMRRISPTETRRVWFKEPSAFQEFVENDENNLTES